MRIKTNGFHIASYIAMKCHEPKSKTYGTIFVMGRWMSFEPWPYGSMSDFHLRLLSIVVNIGCTVGEWIWNGFSHGCSGPGLG